MQANFDPIAKINTSGVAVGVALRIGSAHQHWLGTQISILLALTSFPCVLGMPMGGGGGGSDQSVPELSAAGAAAGAAAAAALRAAAGEFGCEPLGWGTCGVPSGPSRELGVSQKKKKK